jgi:hypothetical protein
MPESWTSVVYLDDRPGKAQFVQRIRVEEMEVNPPVSDADFKVEIRPGMKVRQFTYTGSGPLNEDDVMSSKEFRVGSDGAWNEIVNGVEQPPSRPWWWWAAGLLIPAVGLVAWLVWRVRRRRARGPEAAA